MARSIPENIRCVVYSFLIFDVLLDKISRLSSKEREMLMTKYSEVLQISMVLDPFSKFYSQIEYAIALSCKIEICEFNCNSKKVNLIQKYTEIVINSLENKEITLSIGKSYPNFIK